MSKCLWNSLKWSWGAKEMTPSFACSPVLCECSWKKIQTGDSNCDRNAAEYNIFYGNIFFKAHCVFEDF